jgi:WD40 repeat protein
MFSGARVSQFGIIFFALLVFSWMAFYWAPVGRYFGLNLVRRDFTEKDLSGSNLRWAKLRRAIFTGTHLDGADLRGADLSEAVGLTTAQLATAVLDDSTILPDYLKSPEPLPDESVLDIEPVSITIPLKFTPNKIALANDNSIVAVVGDTEEVKLWTVTDKGLKELKSLKEKGNGRSVCFSPQDHTLLAVGSDDGKIRIGKLNDGEWSRVLEKPQDEGYVFNLKFDVTGTRLVSASQDQAAATRIVNIWNVESGALLRTVVVPSGYRILDLNPDKEVMVIVSEAKPYQFQIRSITDESESKAIKFAFDSDAINVSAESEVTAGAVSSDGKYVVIGALMNKEEDYPDGSIFIRKVDEGKWLPGPPNVLTAYVMSFNFSRTGYGLVAGWSDGSISLWDIGQSHQWLTFSGHSGEILNLAFGQDDKTFGSIADRELRLWTVQQTK